MRKNISGLIKEILVPVMQTNGFSVSIPTKSDWIFENNDEVSGRKQAVCLGVVSRPEKYIKVEMRIIPSFRYHDIDLSEVVLGDENLVKGTLEGWKYETIEDAQLILEVIANSMKSRGFKILSEAQRDNRDLFATAEEHMDLYKNHEQYLKEFCLKHNLQEWNMKELLLAIQNDLYEIPTLVNEENRRWLLCIAAACGAVYMTQNGSWKWNDTGRKMSMISLPFRNMQTSDYLVSPLDLVYQCIQTDARNTISDLILNDLEYTGNFKSDH